MRERWRRRLVLRLERVRARRLREERLRREEVVGGEVGRLRGEEGFGVRGDVLVMVGQVGRERLGAASVWLRWAGHEGRLVIRL